MVILLVSLSIGLKFGTGKKGMNLLKIPIFVGLCQDFQEQVRSKLGKQNT